MDIVFVLFIFITALVIADGAFSISRIGIRLVRYKVPMSTGAGAFPVCQELETVMLETLDREISFTNIDPETIGFQDHPAPLGKFLGGKVYFGGPNSWKLGVMRGVLRNNSERGYLEVEGLAYWTPLGFLFLVLVFLFESFFPSPSWQISAIAALPVAILVGALYVWEVKRQASRFRRISEVVAQHFAYDNTPKGCSIRYSKKEYANILMQVLDEHHITYSYVQREQEHFVVWKEIDNIKVRALINIAQQKMIK